MAHDRSSSIYLIDLKGKQNCENKIGFDFDTWFYLLFRFYRVCV